MADFQRDQDVVAYQGFAGIRNDIPADRFGLTDLAVADNVDIDASGGIARRAGQTRVATLTLGSSLWAQGALGLYVDSGVLKRLNADYTGSALRSGLTPGARMSFEKVNDAVYFSDGHSTGIYQNGVARSWGLEVPALPVPAVTVGSLPAGEYQFVMTALRGDGQESGAGLAGRVTITADGGGLRFALPTASDPGVTHKALYLTTPNGDVLYRAALVASAATTLTYSNDTTELAMPLDTQFCGPAPAGQLVHYYRGYVYVAAGNAVFRSRPYGYELFDLRDYFDFADKVTMLARIEDRDNPGFFIGTEQAVMWLGGSDPTDMKAVPVTDYGCVLGAMDYVDGSMFADHNTGAKMLPMWMSTRGLCIGMPGGGVQNITRSKYIFEAGGSGCALFKPESTQIIAVANS